MAGWRLASQSRLAYRSSSSKGASPSRSSVACWRAERTADAELVGELLQGELHTEDGAALGLAGDPIELAAQGPAQRFDPFHGPMGEVREGAVFDLAVDEKAFAQEDRGWRIAVRDGVDIHANR